jgi:hypothetical protein
MAIAILESLMPSIKPRLTVYFDDEELKRDFEALAKLQDRSGSNFLLQLIKREVAEARNSGILAEKMKQ